MFNAEFYLEKAKVLVSKTYDNEAIERANISMAKIFGIENAIEIETEKLKNLQSDIILSHLLNEQEIIAQRQGYYEPALQGGFLENT